MRIVRMTHIQNIPHILQYGITHRTSANANSNYTPIGDTTIISTRDTFSIPLAGNNTVLGDYIPFYFGFRMPMLLVIQTGYNGVSATAPEEIVYCVSNSDAIIAQGLNFVFTDGHAVNSFSDYYEMQDVMNLANILDSNAINTNQWGAQYGLDIKRKKEAEFLVLGDIPSSCIRGYVVYNQAAEQQLISFGVPQNSIAIRPNYYY